MSNGFSDFDATVEEATCRDGRGYSSNVGSTTHSVEAKNAL